MCICVYIYIYICIYIYIYIHTCVHTYIHNNIYIHREPVQFLKLSPYQTNKISILNYFEKELGTVLVSSLFLFSPGGGDPAGRTRRAGPPDARNPDAREDSADLRTASKASERARGIRSQPCPPRKTPRATYRATHGATVTRVPDRAAHTRHCKSGAPRPRCDPTRPEVKRCAATARAATRRSGGRLESHHSWESKRQLPNCLLVPPAGHEGLEARLPRAADQDLQDPGHGRRHSGEPLV